MKKVRRKSITSQKYQQQKDKCILYPNYKDQAYVDNDSDTYIEMSPTVKDQTKPNKCTCLVTFYTSDASIEEMRIIMQGIKNFNNESSTQDEYTIYSNYYKDLSLRMIELMLMITMVPPVAYIEKYGAFATLSFSRVLKTPLRMTGPNHA
ncbi:hypothetical protein BDF21DRAFT_465248 [Thamnidium elegans]|nr:hypothetical protein BDF21DRAFT_465248 [Thamnidium elegans]